jgi:hypothetical protein
MIATPRKPIPGRRLRFYVLWWVYPLRVWVSIPTDRIDTENPSFHFEFNNTHTEGGQFQCAWFTCWGCPVVNFPIELKTEILFIWTNVKNFYSAIQTRLYYWMIRMTYSDVMPYSNISNLDFKWYSIKQSLIGSLIKFCIINWS